jgi:alcohol dehydrogenase class IV
MGRVGTALGLASNGDAAGALFDLARELGAPASLAELGLPADVLEAAADRIVVETGCSNPRPVDVASVLSMLQQAYAGTRPAAG